MMEPEVTQPPSEAEEDSLTQDPSANAPAENAGEAQTLAGMTGSNSPDPAEPDGEGGDPAAAELNEIELKAILEAVIYIAEEPLEPRQIASALKQPLKNVEAALAALVEDFVRPERGLQIREIAGGYKMATKPEHHESVRQFVKNLKPSLKMTPAALETLAVIAYKQPITAPEIMEIRGVQGGGVLKTLVDRKLITTAGRKNVVGKPILYKTTKEFLLQFGLKSINELPTLKEFEELRRLAFSEDEIPEGTEGTASVAEAESETATAAQSGAELAPAADGSERESDS